MYFIIFSTKGSPEANIFLPLVVWYITYSTGLDTEIAKVTLD